MMSKPNKKNNDFKWSAKPDEIWIPKVDILSVISEKNATGPGAFLVWMKIIYLPFTIGLNESGCNVEFKKMSVIYKIMIENL